MISYTDLLYTHFNGEGVLLLTILEETDNSLLELFDTGSVTLLIDGKMTILTLGVST